jgi:argininosuccinate lyase
MSKLLWQKPGVAVNENIQNFLAGNDIADDQYLFLFDIQASQAHAQGLKNIHLLSDSECKNLCEKLDQLANLFKAGQFILDDCYEDGHSAIEAYLIEHLGDIGRKVHTGRSRNDQVLVASRLYLRDALLQLAKHNKKIAEISLHRAEQDTLLPLPGYTHMQRAMVSSAGMWWAGWAESYIDNLSLAKSSIYWINANPLGSASGFGVNMPLDREYTTKALQFDRIQVAATYAQLSRGKFELQALAALSQSLLDLRRLAWDLSLFTSAEFNFVALPPEYTTGSSLMPNKRNPDLIELLRASYAVVAGARTEIEQLLSLPSGYHRDLQFTKSPLLRAFQHGLSALALVPDLLTRMQWQPENMRAAIEPGMFATDCAMELAANGVPFREAYQQAAKAVLPSSGENPEASLQARISLGAAGNLSLNLLKERLQALHD